MGENKQNLKHPAGQVKMFKPRILVRFIRTRVLSIQVAALPWVLVAEIDLCRAGTAYSNLNCKEPAARWFGHDIGLTSSRSVDLSRRNSAMTEGDCH